MLKLYIWLKDLLRNERGQDMVEYALITTLISVAVVLAVLLTGLIGSFETWASGLGSCITNADSTACPF